MLSAIWSELSHLQTPATILSVSTKINPETRKWGKALTWEVIPEGRDVGNRAREEKKSNKV